MTNADAGPDSVMEGTKRRRAHPSSIEHLVESMDLGIDSLHPGGFDITRQMAEVAGVREGSDVLDVASGTGESACLLATSYRCHILGVDVSPSMVRRATAKALKLGIDVPFAVGDAHELPFGGNRFDLVFSECTVCFLDKERAIGEMIRVTRPGGRVAIHDLAWKEGAPQAVREKLARLENERPETLEGWKCLFEAAGLEDVVTFDRSDVIPGWMRESRKQMGLIGQAKIAWEIFTKTNVKGLFALWQSERIFASRHLGYGIILGRKRRL